MATFTCRYGDKMSDLPDVYTMCRGHCEGMGVFPLKGDDLADPVMKALWLEADAKEPADNGWHFVKCPDCQGTGKRPGVEP
jgi:hypothetical protein